MKTRRTHKVVSTKKYCEVCEKEILTQTVVPYWKRDIRKYCSHKCKQISERLQTFKFVNLTTKKYDPRTL